MNQLTYFERKIKKNLEELFTGLYASCLEENGFFIANIVFGKEKLCSARFIFQKRKKDELYALAKEIIEAYNLCLNTIHKVNVSNFSYEKEMEEFINTYTKLYITCVCTNKRLDFWLKYKGDEMHIAFPNRVAKDNLLKIAKQFKKCVEG